MNKREYLSLISKLNTLPVPGTLLYTPEDKVNGHRLKRYEITEEGITAVVGGGIQQWLDIDWTLEQIKMCTWDSCS